MKNISIKLFLGVNSILLVIIFVFLLQYSEQKKQLEDIKEQISQSESASIYVLQQEMAEKRETLLQDIAHSPAKKEERVETTTTVTPVIVVEPKKSVDKKTKTS